MINKAAAMGGWYWICELKNLRGGYCNKIFKNIKSEEIAKYTYALHMADSHNAN